MNGKACFAEKPIGCEQMTYLQKAENRLTRMKHLQMDSKYPEHAKEHIVVLEWLIERVKDDE